MAQANTAKRVMGGMAIALAAAMAILVGSSLCIEQPAAYAADSGATVYKGVTIYTNVSDNKTLNDRVCKTLKGIVKDGDTQGKALSRVWKYVTKMKYGEVKKNKSPKDKNWATAYASNMLKKKKGNCYSYAAAFAYLAKGLGYDATVVNGNVKTSMGKEPHAWVVLKVAGKPLAKYPAAGNKSRVFDPEGYRDYKSVKVKAFNVVKNKTARSLKYSAYKGGKYNQALGHVS